MCVCARVSHSKEWPSYLFSYMIDPLKVPEELVRLAVILVEFLGNVRADVAIFLFDGLCNIQQLLGGNSHLPFSKELLDKIGDVPASNGDVADAASDDIAFILSKKKEEENTTFELRIPQLASHTSCPMVANNHHTPLPSTILLSPHHWDDMSDTISRVNHRSSQRPLPHLFTGP